MSATLLKQQGCSAEAVARAKASGVTAAALRRIAGCSAQQLKDGDTLPLN